MDAWVRANIPAQVLVKMVARVASIIALEVARTLVLELANGHLSNIACLNREASMIKGLPPYKK